MKKIIIILLAFVQLQCSNAQIFGKKVKGDGNLTEIQKQVGTYQSISISGSFNVEIVEGSEGLIEVSIEENLIEFLEVENNNGHLKIKWKELSNIQTSKGVDIKIPVEDLDKITLAGSGEIFNKEMLKLNVLDLTMAGSGNIKLNLSTNSLVANLAGSGDIELFGSTETARYKMAGSGDIEAFAFKAHDVTASIAGSGSIRLYADVNLKAEIAGSGDIQYKGNPERDDVKVAGSGRVKMVP